MVPLQIKPSKVIPGLVAGKTQVQVAKELGISQPSVSQLAKKVKQQIKDAQLRLISAGIDQAIEGQLAKMQAGKDVVNNDDQDKQIIAGVENSITLQLGDKVEARLMTMVGILPSHAPSVVLNQLFMGNQNTMVLDPGVQQAIAGFTGSLTGHNPDDSSSDEVIDVTDGELEGE